MQRLAKQEIYIYKTPGEEVHQILFGDMDGKRLKAFSKVYTDSGEIAYKIISEDVQQKTEVLVEGKGNAEDFAREVARIGRECLDPLGEKWQEIIPKYITNLDAKQPCLHHKLNKTRS